MPRPVSKKWLKRVEELQEQIEETIAEARTVDQAGVLQEKLADMAMWADEKVCELDS